MSNVAYDLSETQTCEGRDDSAEILASMWQEEKIFEVLKRSHIQIYPTSF